MFHFLASRMVSHAECASTIEWRIQKASTLQPKMSSSKRNLCQILWMKREWLLHYLPIERDENEFYILTVWSAIEISADEHRWKSMLEVEMNRLGACTFDITYKHGFYFKLGDYHIYSIRITSIKGKEIKYLKYKEHVMMFYALKTMLEDILFVVRTSNNL